MEESQSQLQNKSSTSKGRLYIIGIGPGSVPQMTIAARDVLI
jgi:precorrin-3B C17-methyltransferase